VRVSLPAKSGIGRLSASVSDPISADTKSVASAPGAVLLGQPDSKAVAVKIAIAVNNRR